MSKKETTAIVLAACLSAIVAAVVSLLVVQFRLAELNERISHLQGQSEEHQAELESKVDWHAAQLAALNEADQVLLEKFSALPSQASP